MLCKTPPFCPQQWPLLPVIFHVNCPLTFSLTSLPWSPKKLGEAERNSRSSFSSTVNFLITIHYSLGSHNSGTPFLEGFFIANVICPFELDSPHSFVVTDMIFNFFCSLSFLVSSTPAPPPPSTFSSDFNLHYFNNIPAWESLLMWNVICFSLYICCLTCWDSLFQIQVVCSVSLHMFSMSFVVVPSMYVNSIRACTTSFSKVTNSEKLMLALPVTPVSLNK